MNNNDQIFEQIGDLSRALVRELISAGKSVSAAESCTGGWIAKCITDIAGSSACFAYGIVSYSNDAKSSLLKVRPRTLAAHGAVSEAVVIEMATGVLRLSGADLAVAVSGIAGPDGGSDDKPVGTVWFAWAARLDGGKGETVRAIRQQFHGDRAMVRAQAVALALQGLREDLHGNG